MTSNNTEELQREVIKLREQTIANEEEISKLKEKITELEQSLFEPDEDIPKRDFTLREILQNPEVTKAVNTIINAWANIQPDTMKLRFRALHLSITFSLLILLGIGLLGYFSVLSRDVVGGLIGALIGYWYGRQQGKKE